MHIFLAPHYDDAVYSAAGTMARLAGCTRVLVYTVMGGDLPQPLPDTPIVRDLHKRWALGDDPVVLRRAEEVEALVHIGAEGLSGVLPDCVYRTADGHALYPTEESIFSAPAPKDPALTYLADHTLPYTESGVLYAPLAVGGHVDHLIVRDWALRWMNSDWQLCFYTDYPYMRDEAAVAHACETLGIALEPVLQPYGEIEMQARLRAMAAYASQVSTFWSDTACMAAEVRQMFASSDGYAERFWRPVISA